VESCHYHGSVFMRVPQLVLLSYHFEARSFRQDRLRDRVVFMARFSCECLS
jgi:hypothetical protein